MIHPVLVVAPVPFPSPCISGEVEGKSTNFRETPPEGMGDQLAWPRRYGYRSARQYKIRQRGPWASSSYLAPFHRLSR